MSEIKQKATPTDWTDDRCDDMDILIKLLNEVKSLNSGSHFITRVQECIGMAEALTAYDYQKNTRIPFADFLNKLCIKDRFPEPPKTPQGGGSEEC